MFRIIFVVYLSCFDTLVQTLNAFTNPQKNAHRKKNEEENESSLLVVFSFICSTLPNSTIQNPPRYYFSSSSWWRWFFSVLLLRFVRLSMHSHRLFSAAVLKQMRFFTNRFFFVLDDGFWTLFSHFICSCNVMLLFFFALVRCCYAFNFLHRYYKLYAHWSFHYSFSFKTDKKKVKNKTEANQQQSLKSKVFNVWCVLNGNNNEEEEQRTRKKVTNAMRMNIS